MKRNLLIHNPINIYTNGINGKTYYRDYNLFWDELTDKLKEKHDVEENRNFENAHKDRFEIFLKKRSIDSLLIRECEYVIEDKDSGDFWIVSMDGQIPQSLRYERHNPHFIKGLYGQYIPDQMLHHLKEYANKVLPWIFFPSTPHTKIDYDLYYNYRKKKTNLIPKMFFKGLDGYRPILNHINKDYLSENNKVPVEIYFNELIDYKMVFSVGGTANGDICYRDIECMAVGVPIIKFEFVTTLNPGLIPNYHYISIPTQLDFPIHNGVLKDRMGEEKHAKLLEKRFLEVINDENYLKFVSENARRYYDEYLSPKVRAEYTLKLLNL